MAGVAATTPQEPSKRHRENTRHRQASGDDGGVKHADVPDRAPA
jgi:hypothetical protein